MMEHIRTSLVEKCNLTVRESDVAFEVALGKSNHDIGAALFITEKTVKFHLTNIFKVMKLESRAELIVFILTNIGNPNSKTAEIPQGLSIGKVA